MKYYLRKNWQNILFESALCVVFVILSIFLFHYQTAIDFAFCGASRINETALQVYTFDVGQAGANLIVLPNKVSIVIDTGSEQSQGNFLSQLDYILNKNGIKQIDYLFLSHSDEDHIGGAKSVLDKYQVNRIFRPKIISATSEKEISNDTFLQVYTQAYADAIDAIYSEPNCTVSFIENRNFYFDDVSIFVWAAEETSFQSTNYYSPFIRLEYCEKNYLFTADATSTRENEFLAKYGSLGEDFEVDYLFVSHHGSKYSSTTNFLQKIKPKVAIVSCGESGYPARQVVERLNDVGVEKIYKTSESGTIICAQGESGTTSITEISFSLDSAFIVVVLGICMLVVCKILNENKDNSKFVSIKIEK